MGGPLPSELQFEGPAESRSRVPPPGLQRWTGRAQLGSGCSVPGSSQGPTRLPDMGRGLEHGYSPAPSSASAFIRERRQPPGADTLTPPSCTCFLFLPPQRFLGKEHGLPRQLHPEVRPGPLPGSSCWMVISRSSQSLSASLPLTSQSGSPSVVCSCQTHTIIHMVTAQLIKIK